MMVSRLGSHSTELNLSIPLTEDDDGNYKLSHIPCVNLLFILSFSSIRHVTHSPLPSHSSPTYPHHPPTLITHLPSPPTYPHHPPTLIVHLPSPPTYPHHPPTLITHLPSSPTYPHQQGTKGPHSRSLV